MARRSFDDETLAWVREMPLSQVLDKLRDDGQLFWRRDPDFVPEKDKRTVRLFLSSPSGFAWEVLVTGLKWFDVRAGKGGGGGIDLVMHLLGIDFAGLDAELADGLLEAVVGGLVDRRVVEPALVGDHAGEVVGLRRRRGGRRAPRGRRRGLTGRGGTPAEDKGEREARADH